jgi:glycosyl transferase family 25
MTPVPILLINLDRAGDRLARMQARLGECGAAFERVPAVDARALGEVEFARHVSGPGYWGLLTPGEVACFLSHRKCWQMIIERNLPCALVLEDDVVIGQAGASLLASDGWVPADADIVKLETDFKPVRLAARAASREAGHDVVRLYSSHYCAAAYLVTQAAARRLLAATECFRDAVDEMLFAVRSPLSRSLTIYQMDPAPFVQEHKHADPRSLFDPSGFIDGRESKERPRRPVLVEFAGDLAQACRDLSHKVRTVAGQRRTAVVEHA